MKTPLRTCAGCGAKRIKNEMIRIGMDERGEPAISGVGKHTGRGSYVCALIECVGKAKKNGGLSRALRRNIPACVYEELELEIEDRQKVTSG